MNNDETCLIFDLIHSSPNLKNKKIIEGICTMHVRILFLCGYCDWT